MELRKAGQRIEALQPLSVLEVGEGVALSILGASPDEATDRMDRAHLGITPRDEQVPLLCGLSDGHHDSILRSRYDNDVRFAR